MLRVGSKDCHIWHMQNYGFHYNQILMDFQKIAKYFLFCWEFRHFWAIFVKIILVFLSRKDNKWLRLFEIVLGPFLEPKYDTFSEMASLNLYTQVIVYYLDLGYDGGKRSGRETDDIWEKKYGQRNFLPPWQQKKIIAVTNQSFKWV